MGKFNKFLPGGGGVGASSTATRRAKNRLATVCEGKKCFPCYTTLGVYSHNPNGVAPCDLSPPAPPPPPPSLLDWLVYALNRGPGAGILDTNYGWDASGVWFNGSSDTVPAYPVFTNFTIPTSCSVTVTVDFVYNEVGSDFGMCVYLDGTIPEWRWYANPTRIACQYDYRVPNIYGLNNVTSNEGDILIVGNTYTAQMIYDPNNIPNVTFNTLLNGTILETLTLNDVLPSGNYLIGFTADRDNINYKTYMKNLTITINCEGTTVYTSPLQNIIIQQ